MIDKLKWNISQSYFLIYCQFLIFYVTLTTIQIQRCKNKHESRLMRLTSINVMRINCLQLKTQLKFYFISITEMQQYGGLKKFV